MVVEAEEDYYKEEKVIREPCYQLGAQGGWRRRMNHEE